MSIQKLLRRALPEHFAPSLRTTIILLASSLVFGLCHVAALPPFEGFDEYQHYAYIQQIAKTGTWPRFGDKASRYIEDYVAFAPGPLAGGAKYDYADFFAGNADRIEEVRRAVNDAREPPPSVEPGTVPNWEAQHPPLFYALLAPFYLASQTWSLGHQLLLLRSGSYLLAWLSLCVAVIAAARHGPVVLWVYINTSLDVGLDLQGASDCLVVVGRKFSRLDVRFDFHSYGFLS